MQLIPSQTHDVCGRKVLVFDDLFPAEQVTRFSTVVMQLGFRRRDSFDRELNVGIDRSAFMKAPFLYPFTEAAIDGHRDAFTLEGASTKLSHVYAAAITRGDTPHLHADHPSSEAVTFLYYANLRWDESWGGATEFHDANGAAVTVLPKPGRLTMFHSNILHRGGLPHPDTPTFRYTVSVFYYPDPSTSSQASAALRIPSSCLSRANSDLMQPQTKENE